MSRRKRQQRRAEHYRKTAMVQNLAPWQVQTASAERWSIPQDGHLYRRQAELYQRLSWVQIAVSIPARMVATVPFNVKQYQGEKLTDIPNHDFERLLAKPNPLQSRFEFLEMLYSYRRLTGNAYIWLNRASEADEPTEMWILPSHRVLPVPDGNMYLRGYLFESDHGVTVPLECYEVVHFKLFHPLDSFVGLSPIEALATVAVADMKMQEWNANYFGRDNGKVPGILAFADQIGEAQWQQMGEDIKRQYGGTNRGGLMRLRGAGKGGVEWIATSISQKDMEFLQGRNFNKEEIFALYAPGLSSVLSVNATEANATEAGATLRAYAIHPDLCAIAEKITLDILPAYGDNLKGEFEDVRTKDRELELKEIGEYAKTHTIDEVREKYYNDKPLEDGRGQHIQGGGGGAATDQASGTQPILGYHIESGVVGKNEARATLGLSPVDESEAEAQRKLKAKLEIVGVATAAKIPLDVAAKLAGLDLPESTATTTTTVPAEQAQPPVAEPAKPRQVLPATKAHSGAMLAFYPSPTIAGQLAIEGGELPDDLHLTLAYLGDTQVLGEDAKSQLMAALMVLSGLEPVNGVVSGIGRFNNDEGDGIHAVYASFDAPSLPTFHNRLVEIVKTAGVDLPDKHGFTPHITLAYVPEFAPLPVTGVPRLAVTFDRLTLMWGDERFDVALAIDTAEQDMQRFERKSLKAVKNGKSAAVSFESDALPGELVAELQHDLCQCSDVTHVKAVFGSYKAQMLTPEEQALADRILAILAKAKRVSVNDILAGREPSLELLQQLLQALLLPTANTTALATLDSLADDIGLAINVDDATASLLSWASDYTPKMVKGITDTTAKILKQAIETYRATPGMTRGDLEQLLEYTFGPKRAESIAITEITRAANQSTLSYQRWLAENSVTMTRIWRTSNDDKTCPVCAPLNGKPESEWGETYPDGAPAHPRCRCFTTLKRVKGDA